MKKGFTLLEVLGSVLILGGLIAVVSQVTYGSFKRVEKSRSMQKITTLLQQKMLELESEYKSENIFNLPSEDKGVFEGETNYVWKYETRSLEMPPSLTLLSIQNFPQTDMNIKLADLIKEVLTNTVVELKLTVTYKKAKKSADYSLVSYFINYGDVPAYIQNIVSKFIPSSGNTNVLEGEPSL